MSDDWSDPEFDPNDPWVAAWADQFGALVRDKARGMVEAVKASGFSSLAHYFEDPADGSPWRLIYRDGQFWLMNLELEQGEDGALFRLDLKALGVIR
jgi:hypothetical protein